MSPPSLSCFVATLGESLLAVGGGVFIRTVNSFAISNRDAVCLQTCATFRISQTMAPKMRKATQNKNNKKEPTDKNKARNALPIKNSVRNEQKLRRLMLNGAGSAGSVPSSGSADFIAQRISECQRTKNQIEHSNSSLWVENEGIYASELEEEINEGAQMDTHAQPEQRSGIQSCELQRGINFESQEDMDFSIQTRKSANSVLYQPEQVACGKLTQPQEGATTQREQDDYNEKTRSDQGFDDDAIAENWEERTDFTLTHPRAVIPKYNQEKNYWINTESDMESLYSRLFLDVYRRTGWWDGNKLLSATPVPDPVKPILFTDDTEPGIPSGHQEFRLPSELLLSILESLPYRDAIRFSKVSTLFQNHYKTLKQIDITVGDILSGDDTSVETKFVGLLQKHNAPQVRSLTVRFDQRCGGSKALFLELLEFIEKKGVINVVLLDCGESFFGISQFRLSVSVRRFSLSLRSGCEVTGRLSPNLFVNLEDLRITCQNITQGCLDLVSHLPFLKVLWLRGNFFGELGLDIRSEPLNSLHLNCTNERRMGAGVGEKQRLTIRIADSPMLNEIALLEDHHFTIIFDRLLKQIQKGLFYCKGDFFGQNLHTLSIFQPLDVSPQALIGSICEHQKLRSIHLHRFHGQRAHLMQLMKALRFLTEVKLTDSVFKGSEIDSSVVTAMPNIRKLQIEYSAEDAPVPEGLFSILDLLFELKTLQMVIVSFKLAHISSVSFVVSLLADRFSTWKKNLQKSETGSVVFIIKNV